MADEQVTSAQSGTGGTEGTPSPGASGGAPPVPGSAPAAKPGQKTLAEERAELAQIAETSRQRRAARMREQEEARTLREENARLKSETAQWNEWRDLAGKDRIAAAKRLGIDPKALAEDIVRSGTPEEKLAEFDRRLRESEEARQKLEQQQAERLRASELSRAQLEARERLIGTWDEAKADLPMLAKVVKDDPERMLREYMVVYRMIQHDPETAPYVHTYTDREILDAANARLDSLLKDLSGDAQNGAAVQSGTSRQGKQAGSSGAKTLSNDAASERASGAPSDELDRKPGESFQQWDRRQNAILAKRLKEQRG